MATGIQPIEDYLPLVKHNPRRFRLVANINLHLHFPLAEEVARQVTLGAVALKLHPVHGGFILGTDWPGMPGVARLGRRHPGRGVGR